MSNIDLLAIDPDRLFEQYTINEIVEIHSQIQVELDRKRQELRYMVGERYRDVITAADTIKSMQNHSELLVDRIYNINKKCRATCATVDSDTIGPSQTDKSKAFHRSIAIQIKILVLIPEYIWSCLDVGNYLKATQLYLLAIHIHTGLELDTEYKIPERFTLLSRLRLSINSFRNRIVDGIKKQLQCVKLSPEEASCQLCAYMLLENANLTDVLSILMELREAALRELFLTNLSTHNTVRSQIMSLMSCLLCTIHLVHASFVGRDGLVVIHLGEICSKQAQTTIESMDLEPTPLLQYLPSIVTDFRPSCTGYEGIEIQKHVQEAIRHWLECTADILRASLSYSLDLVTSVKALHTIRQDSLKLDVPTNWDKICTDLCLGDFFSVWHFFFQPLVSSRAEKLVSRKIEMSINSLLSEIVDTVLGTDTDLRLYVWFESMQDLSKDSNEHAGLSMKTKGYSERIVSVCKHLDNTCLELLQDVSLYLYRTDDQNTSQQYNEKDRLELHLSQKSSQSIDELIKHLEQFLSEEKDDSMKFCKTVTCARLLQSMCQLCPNLVKCCSRGDNRQDWHIVECKLIDYSLSLWQHWFTVTISYAKNAIHRHFLNVNSRNMIKILTRWQIIDIEEQAEEKIVKSQIRIPVQPTVMLLGFLSDINKDMSSVLPHTLPKLIHVRFTESLTELLLGQYQVMSEEETLNQNRALQFLFDIKFITTICIRRDNRELMAKSQCTCDCLRSIVDPFDLDVFYSHLQTNIKRAVLQSQALFGCLLPFSEHLANLGVLENCTTDREPSVLAISALPNDTWFPLLPVTMPVFKTIDSQSVISSTSHTPKRSTLPKSNTETSSTTLVRSGAAALFGAMTNDWFS